MENNLTVFLAFALNAWKQWNKLMHVVYFLFSKNLNGWKHVKIVYKMKRWHYTRCSKITKWQKSGSSTLTDGHQISVAWIAHFKHGYLCREQDFLTTFCNCFVLKLMTLICFFSLPLISYFRMLSFFMIIDAPVYLRFLRIDLRIWNYNFL